MPTPTPKKRGPGRPRKHPLPDPAPAPEPVEPAQLEDKIDFRPIVLEVVREFGMPVTPPEIATLTELETPRVTEILDELVTSGELTLGDDQFYRLPGESESEPDIIGPPVTQEDSDAAGAESLIVPANPDNPLLAVGEEVTIEGEFDDTLRQNVVYLPSSDIVAFLKNINLPPQLLAGFGIPSEVHGFIDFEDAVPSEGETQASGAFRVVLYGKHLNTTPLLNPNQPGYESQIQHAIAPQDLTAGAVES